MFFYHVLTLLWNSACEKVKKWDWHPPLIFAVPTINQSSNLFKRARRLWVLLSQTAWLVVIDSCPRLKCQYHLFWVVSQKKKKSSSLITAVGEQVALLQRATTIGNTVWYTARNVRQPIHGPVGHLPAADNSIRRRIFTDLWPPLRGIYCTDAMACAQKQTYTYRICSS